MRLQACEPCAKRKVRCDREDPCSNCKRRKKDTCTYLPSSPQDRIRELENIVRNLGGDPGSARQIATPSSLAESSVQGRQNTAQEKASIDGYGDERLAILNEDGQPVYVERHAWQNYFTDNQIAEAHTELSSRNMSSSRQYQNAFDRLLNRGRFDFASKHPPAETAAILWNIYLYRISPLVPISFRWDLENLQSIATHPERRKQLSDAENGYVFAIYLLATYSLSEQECISQLHQAKSEALAHCQLLCEDALASMNLLCISDIITIKALTVYINAGLDRLSTTSLWSLMGLVIRSAEKMGLHRDGALLNRSPLEIEERRRLWWHLQHLDLILTIRSGISPLTLSADWDTKLPLNIEDDDISPDLTTAPNERKGLTEMSYCLFTYWTIDQQRKFSRSDNSSSGKSILSPLNEAMVDQLEDGLNEKFLRFCDPIKSMDTFLQIMARALICLFRLRNLLPFTNSLRPGLADEKRYSELIRTCRQSLEYYIAFHTQPSLQRFRWATQTFFPWHAFMCLLVDISQENALMKLQQSWDLLSKVYNANLYMFDLPEDRRRVQAAELIVNAWKGCKGKFHDNSTFLKPDFVSQLEVKLSELQSDRVTEGQPAQPVESFGLTGALSDQDALITFDFDFEDIDWSFWSSID